MLKADERLGGFLEELFRYRFALTRQEARLAVAKEELQKTRERLDEEAVHLLFSPEWTEEWFREQYERLEYLERPEVWQLKTEAQFLLVAVRGIYFMSKALKHVATGSAKRSIQQAISEFEGTAPDAMLLRDIHEHFDSYGGGKGRKRHRLPEPDEAGAVAMAEEGLVYYLGGRLFDLDGSPGRPKRWE